MKARLKISVVMFLCMVLGYTSCTQKSEYQKLVDRELAKNIRQDSLFLGMSLEMASKDFFDLCQDLNQKGILTNGVGNDIKYDVSEEFKHPTLMFFYPKFVNRKIYEMPIEFRYKNWSLWNKELKVENLMEEVKSVLEKWYGEGFIKMTNKDGSKTVWVKVDGNRRIRLYRESVSSVAVVITDLSKSETES